jgi:hypothetical protein
MFNPHGSRKLAAWYREFAEHAGNPVIWERRLRTAEELTAEGDRHKKETNFEQHEQAAHDRSLLLQ